MQSGVAARPTRSAIALHSRPFRALLQNESFMLKTLALSGALFQSFPEIGQLVGIEVGQNLSVDINHGSQGLAGQMQHFTPGRRIRENVERFVSDTSFLEPILGLVAPTTIRFDEQPDVSRFHH
jgi:hypothetical protein